ncbi:hypothetical protein TRIUR3_01898 [Triticum urartu]|uniref:RING-CH-type domain-containing protein n=2 Tax=Triticum TaxID=4564 RepID=A0A9R0WNI0_TRITD|nr:hypothetical protein TRIUR3_01898 [Triticum urartu]VAI18139.1 unnamed protein product [Triticum turgidum subsp. durum]
MVKDHLMLNVDRLMVPEPIEITGAPKSSSSRDTTALPITGHSFFAVGDSMVPEEEPLLQITECRICQEEDDIKNLESPCACTGSVKLYQLSSMRIGLVYKDGAMRKEMSHVKSAMSGGWTITGTAFDLRDPRILAVAQNHIMEAEYDDYSATNASTAAFCRSAALVLMALLLLRHALTLTDEDDDDTSAMFSLFLLRAAGFLLPFYIMAWAISILQRRRHRQEAAALAATEVAFILQSGQGRGVHFTIAPDSPATPQHEPQP